MVNTAAYTINCALELFTKEEASMKCPGPADLAASFTIHSNGRRTSLRVRVL